MSTLPSDTRRVKLRREVLEAKVAVMLSDYGIPLSNATVEATWDSLGDQLIGHIRVYLMTGMAEPVKTTLKTPKNTWQHFKHQVFPAWLKKLSPVKYEEHTFTLHGPKYLCPHVDMPKNGPHVEFAMMTRPPHMREAMNK